MAQRRMFSLDVVGTDQFLEMPISTQALYFHLGMAGDDDGFVSSPKKVARCANCSLDDLRMLVTKGFVIPFEEEGIIVIRDWRVNNVLKSDRYRGTIYQKERSLLTLDENRRYQLGSTLEPGLFQNGSKAEPDRTQSGTMLVPQEIEGGKVIKEGDNLADNPPSRTKFQPPSVQEVSTYIESMGYHVDAACFVDFYETNGWRQGRGKQIKDWKACVRTWERRDQNRTGATQQAEAADMARKRFFEGGST